MKTILMVGGGGREHALLVALSQSKHKPVLHAAPGNAGIAEVAFCHNVKADDINGITALAAEVKADYVFVSPDDPLVLGMVDVLNARGFKTFGPTQAAAAIEGSKSFSKSFMSRYDIPTAAYAAFSNPDKADAYLDGLTEFPVVIKADGLALGKGVVIAEDLTAAKTAVDGIMRQRKFGKSGGTVVIEEFISGHEVTLLAVTDGTHYFLLPPSTDHKRALDGDLGPNTGGMGVFAPSPFYTAEIDTFTRRNIIEPTLRGLAVEGRTFTGCLYFGLMIDDKGGVKVVEYNARFGDPETQTVLPLVDVDWVDVIEAVRTGTLNTVEVKPADAKAAACVIMASGGYPEKYETGKTVYGIDRVCERGRIDELHSGIYHSGTRIAQGGGYVTSGGRVLAVTAVADTLEHAVAEAYEKTGMISFEGAYYRRDIGKKISEAG